MPGVARAERDLRDACMPTNRDMVSHTCPNSHSDGSNEYCMYIFKHRQSQYSHRVESYTRRTATAPIDSYQTLS